MSDRHLLYAATLLRAIATALLGVVLGLYLAALGIGAASSGVIVSAGLAGATVGSLAVTLRGDTAGRRRVLLVLALASGLAGFALLNATSTAALAALAFIGMANGMGRDRGPALVLEQAMLPATTTDAERTGAFAIYAVMQDVGHALGGLAAACIGLLPAAPLDALRIGLGMYAALLLATAVLYTQLGPAVEAPRFDSVQDPGSARAARPPAARLSPETRRALVPLSGLFALDSIAGGFLTAALLSVFFAERFGVGAAAIGTLFLFARVLNALSHLAAAWLARRIGLVRTMVFTHIPSSLLLITVAAAPTFAIAAALFLLREGLVEMDVPTRQSYVMAIVKPEERTVAAGVTQLVRTGGWAIGPLFAGLAMEGVAPAVPLIAAALMKIAYDIALWIGFRRHVPPEEQV